VEAQNIRIVGSRNQPTYSIKRYQTQGDIVRKGTLENFPQDSELQEMMRGSLAIAPERRRSSVRRIMSVQRQVIEIAGGDQENQIE
jgi:hypothetical protein